MKLTRRNTLIGLGAVAGGAGVISATGAFDAVEAQRDFNVEVAGDASALLGLDIHNEAVVGLEEGGAGGNDVIYFTLDGDVTDSDQPAVNEDAVTDFYGVFSITNNGSQLVEVSIDPGAAAGVTFPMVDGRSAGGHENDDDGDLGDGIDLGVGESVLLDLRIDTREEGYVGPADRTGGDANEPYEMTIEARSEDAQ